ncbi:hypothetical protein ACFRQM_09425 [Streptomyces sp. NPDC056831]|uniref:hypothetical protein n=1 Tax=Streptomyces sp. NPDC056831 TaxID=3345954 RepID=UPI0036C3ADB2
MATHDPKKAAAELDRLTAAFTRAEERLEQARVPLHAAIVRHLKERSAPPGKIAEHSPYDRNYVGKLGTAAEVPPLRGPDRPPAPVYNDDTAGKAYAELDKLTAAYQRAQGKVEQARVPLHDAIVRNYSDRTLPPGKIAEHTPYDRNHVGKIVKRAGAPLIRG